MVTILFYLIFSAGQIRSEEKDVLIVWDSTPGAKNYLKSEAVFREQFEYRFLVALRTALDKRPEPNDWKLEVCFTGFSVYDSFHPSIKFYIMDQKTKQKFHLFSESYHRTKAEYYIKTAAVSAAKIIYEHSSDSQKP